MEKVTPFRPQTVDFEELGISELNNIIFAETEDGPLRMDCMWDDSVRTPKPVILWVHGGGFREENITRKSRPEQRFAELIQKGYFIASVDYRLINVRRYPAPLEDCKCAVRYLRANAEKLGIDPGRIGVWGESCGGQMAGIMGIQGGLEGRETGGGYEGISSDVQAVLNWYGSLAIEYFLDFIDKRDNPDRTDSFLGRYMKRNHVETEEEAWEKIHEQDPMYYLKNGRQFAPILAVCSDADVRVPVDACRVFCEEAAKYGQTAEFINVPNQGHGYFEGKEYYDKMYEFFDKWLMP